jgi:hypothetical protein
VNTQKLSWTAILPVLVMALGAAWLVFFEEWTPAQAYGALMASNLAVLAAALGGGLVVAVKGHRLEFLQAVVNTIKDDFDEVFGSTRKNP